MSHDSSIALDRIPGSAKPCPHALGLAIPLVIAISTSLGARSGLMVKDRLALERARELQVVDLNKTGTLTKGQPVVADVHATTGGAADVLAVAAAVESDSEHPLARAIVEEATRRGLEVPSATDFESLAGRGARGRVDGRTVSVGGPRLLGELGLQPISETEAWALEGQTVLHVVSDGRVVGAIAVEDEIRPESSEAITDLHDLGLKVAMLTGDSQAVADSVARRLGIDEVAAQVLPADKAAAVRRFQDGGRKVAMVGDGVNDAPALATADVGIAIGAGTDVAVESAGIVLVRSDPRDVVGAMELARASYRKMIQNLVWATGYNLVAIPVAAGVLVPWGIDLPMAVGAIAMSASTIIVAANAQLLRGLNSGTMMCRRRDRPPPDLHPPPHEEAVLSRSHPERVLDPVCGMTVDVAIAEAEGLTAEYGGRTFAFCRSGCQRAFLEDPAGYAAKAETAHAIAVPTAKGVPVIDEGMRRWYESCSCCLSDAYPDIKAALDAERAAKAEPPVDPGICEIADAQQEVGTSL